MASFSMEDFVGNGALKDLIPKLLQEGWDDIPTLKMMNSEDMDAINMTQKQKDALEIRSYLHDRDLMQYGDKLEASGKTLPEILNASKGDVATNKVEENEKGKYDNQRILEILAKMEKRRQRFLKEPPPIAAAASVETTTAVGAEANKQQRPARKRR